MVVSLHHYGWHFSGIMAVSAFAEIHHRSPEFKGDSDRDRSDRELVPCIDKVFSFTKDDAGEPLLRNLDSWIDEALAVTLRILGTSAS